MSPTTPKISLLLPVWNAAATLPGCLRSIERQSETDFECIVIDDGSTDESLRVANHFAERDARFRVFREPHEGLLPTLRTGTERCRAPVVVRMDADDWMHRDRLALQHDMLLRHPELLAVGCFVRLFPRAGLSDGRRAYERWLNSMTDPETIWRDRFIECPIAHPTLAIRREALYAHPYRDSEWPEDYDLVLRLLENGPRVGIVPRKLIGWRDLPTRLSRTDERYALERFTACRAWHLSHGFLRDRRHYVLWGHGRTGRALRRALGELGHHPETIVDVHPRRIGREIRGAEVIAPEALTSHARSPLIVSVAGARPRGEIRTLLRSMGWYEGRDFFVAA